jgi:hypothetical protein
MKSENFKLGRQLSRNELKQIKGGGGICPVGSGVPNCECVGHPGNRCAPGTGGTQLQSCTALCMQEFGPMVFAQGAVGCVVGACQP